MKRHFTFLTVVLLFFVLFSDISCSEAASLKSQIIGKWVEADEFEYSIEFLKDGTVILVGEGSSRAGDYRFIDDNRIRMDFGEGGIFGSGKVVFEVSIDREELLILKEPTGKVTKFITEPRAKKRKEAKAYSDQGKKDLKEKKYDQAIEKFNGVIALNPNDSKAYLSRGFAYGNKGQYEKAIADYNKAIALYPNYANAYNNRGYAYHKQSQYDRAIEDYNKAIAIDPNYANAYNSRGYAYHKQSQYDRAMEDYNKAIALNPKGALPYANLSAIYSLKGDESAACNWLKKAIEKGYKEWDYIKKDSDFDKIRNSDCYKRIMEGR